MINKKVFVYVVILNWNGWKDTIECLESVFRLDYEYYRVIVCDNLSADGSLDHIKAWAEGRLDVFLPQDTPLRHLSFPPISKPIPYMHYDRNEAEAGGANKETDCPLVLIQTGANSGFAGGNNVGLRYVLARNDFEYVWLLNNDTVTHHSSLSALVESSLNYPEAGICGSTLLYYAEPEKIQALGGAVFNRVFARSKHIGKDNRLHFPIDEGNVINQTDYVVGASMFVSRSFLDTVGLLSEDYFLFYEEIDWCTRARSLFKINYSSKSLVYHKEGSSIGSSWDPSLASNLADYYTVRNRLYFTRKYYPYLVPIVLLSLFLVLFNRLRRKHFVKARQVIGIIYYFIFKPSYDIQHR